MPRPRGTPAPRTQPQPQPQPVEQAAPPATSIPIPQPIDEGGVSPLMISSLPLSASGADVYARQFYRPTSKLPQRRYLPVIYQ